MTHKKRISFLERLTGISDVEENNSKNIKSDYSNSGDNDTYSGSDYSNQKVEIEQDNSDGHSSVPNQEEPKLKEKKSNRKGKNNMTSDDDNEEGQLTLDVYQTPEEIVIKSTIAGVSANDLDISIANDMVTIKGERKNDEEVRAEDYYYQECYWGKFSRSVILPVDIDPDKSKATLKNGILTIRLPKIERTKTKKIKIVEE